MYIKGGVFLRYVRPSKCPVCNSELKIDISYPTVKSRLNQLITALGFEDKELEDEKKDKKREREIILGKLDRGEITSSEALKELEKLK